MRRVVWTRAARRDIEGIVAYIAEGNPSAAQAVRTRLHDAVASLGVLPTGRPGRATSTYEKIVRGLPYIVAYSLNANADGLQTLTILRLIHGARDWTSDRWPDEDAP
jgi:plasmid stabilization system protein ParE